MLVVEAVWAAAAELGVAEVRDSAEDRRNPAGGPTHIVLDLPKGAGSVGRVGQRAQQLAHEVAAAVVKPGDFAGIAHCVLRGVLAEAGRASGLGHGPKLPVAFNSTAESRVADYCGQRLAVYELTRPGAGARLGGRHDFGRGSG
jgi:hypothetical protein